ncbi:MAG TPA: hypothetical protein VGY56_06995 [Verrucomicrobiae bacterium]|nr:hypothetical protein [Verrucomicrobiae bacterium]
MNFTESYNVNSSLTEAVVLWTGWGKNPSPKRDDLSLTTRFGSEVASKLLLVVKSIEKEFYKSEAWKVAKDLNEMSKMATDDFKKDHPEIPDAISQAFAWCYTFDYK